MNKYEAQKRSDSIETIGAIIGMFCLIAIIAVFPVYYLWNWLMPHLFGLPVITLWESLGINLLFNFLTGGIKFNGKK